MLGSQKRLDVKLTEKVLYLCVPRCWAFENIGNSYSESFPRTDYSKLYDFGESTQTHRPTQWFFGIKPLVVINWVQNICMLCLCYLDWPWCPYWELRVALMPWLVAFMPSKMETKLWKLKHEACCCFINECNILRYHVPKLCYEC